MEFGKSGVARALLSRVPAALPDCQELNNIFFFKPSASVADSGAGSSG